MAPRCDGSSCRRRRSRLTPALAPPQLEAAGGEHAEGRAAMDRLKAQLDALERAAREGAAARDAAPNHGGGGAEADLARQAAALEARLAAVDARVAALNAPAAEIVRAAGGGWLGEVQAAAAARPEGGHNGG